MFFSLIAKANSLNEENQIVFTPHTHFGWEGGDGGFSSQISLSL